MERKRFWEQTWLGLRALAVITVMLLTTVTASAIDYFVAEYDGSTLTFKKTTTAPDNSSSWDVSDTGTSNPGWYSCEFIWKVVFDPSFAEARPKSCYKWFKGCEMLFSIEGLEYLNTSEVTTMADMFNYCRGLAILDLSHFNTYKVNTMKSMFYDCVCLKTLCIGNEFYVGSSVDTDKMFGGCYTLTGANGTLRVRGMKPVINKDIFTGFEGTLMADDDLDGSWCGGTFNTVKRMRAYAQLSGSTLTFKYEEHPSALGDNEWDVTNTGVGLGNYGWQSNNIDITQVVFDPSFADARPKSCSKWFYACYDLTTIEGIEYLNTSEVTSMQSMFDGCSNLTSLDVSHFNTSQVTNMNHMFANCRNLANLDVSHFDTHNVTDFVSMFNGCKGLTSLDVSHFNTSKAVAVGWMFQDCSGLTSLDVSHFNTRNVSEDYTRSMQNMFAGCSSLTSLDLSSFDTSNATNMNCMFQGCSSLQTLNLSSFDTGNVKDMYGMFDGCSSLQSLDLSTFNTSQVTNMYGMFKNCSNLACLSIGSGFTVNETTDYTNKVGYTRTENMFSGCTALPEGTLIVKGTTAPSIHESQTIFNGFTGTLINEVNLSADWCGGSFSNVGTGTAYAVLTDNDEGKKTLTFKYGVQTPDNQTSWDVTNTGTSYPRWYEAQNMPQRNITKVVFDPSFAVVRPQSCYSWFSGCGGLTTIEGIVNLNTSEVTNMKNMFYNCTSLTKLDVSHFNTSKVTDLSYMFYYCNGLTSLDVSHFNTEKVTRIDGMFYRCSELTSLDVSHFNTSKVENMYAMFEKCESLTSLDVSHFNTSQVTKMDWMFYGCSSLTNLDVSHFDTRQVTMMSSMFMDCSSLTSLDLSSFNTGNVTNISKMFWGCSQLASLSIGKDFTVGSGTTITDMFDGCTALPEGRLIMMVTGTTAPSIAPDIFTNVYRGGTLITNLTKEQLGITDTSSPYTWKGGTFKSVGGVSIQYLDENGVPQTADNALPITAISSDLPGGWYYAEGNVNLNHMLEFTGGAHLILCDGAEMKVNGIWGIDCNSGSLAIYGQSSGNNMGSLTAIGENAGIRCQSLTIANCQVNAESIINTGIDCPFEIFTISGARVTVSGRSGIYSKGLTVTNSIVTAQGARYGIHIYGNNIIFNNGEIYATGGDVGIRYSEPFIFNGGKIEAISTGTGTNPNQYGIYGDSNFIIGCSDPDNDYIYASSYKVENGIVKTADGKGVKAFIPAATEGDSDKPFAYIAGGHTLTDAELTALAGKKLVPNPDGLAYLDWDATANNGKGALENRNTCTDNITANDFVYVLTGGADATLGEGWYAVTGKVDYTGGLTLLGETHLVLADGATLTVGNTVQMIWGNSRKVGIYAIGDFTVYGQTSNSGTLKVNAADITANSDIDYGIFADNITINGGTVKSVGSYGIYSNNYLSIIGGTVNATGDQLGIYAIYDITISGGKVTATGGTDSYFAGIASAMNKISLGWTNADDYIYATCYKVRTAETVSVDASAGQRFVAWTPAATEGGAEEASSIVGSGTVGDLTTIAGKTLRPLDGYYVEDVAGLTFSGKTAPDFTISDTPYYIFKADDVVTLTTDKDYGQNGVEPDASPVVSTTSSTTNAATITMPASDVTINGLKYYNTGVKYMDWDDTQKTLVSKTTADGTKVYILTGGGLTTLDGGWYVVTNWNTAADGDGHSPDAAYTSLLQFNGATHLILADGAEMSVDILDSDTQGFGYAIFVKNSDLATLDIYGQALGTGALTAKSARFDAIYLRSTNSGSKSNLTINGGKVSATCSTSYDGIFVCGGVNSTASVIINGGEVTTASDRANAINAYSGNASVTITGGQVEASGNNGIKTNGDITLNLTNGSDFIKASSYEADGSVKIPAGKALACTIGEYTTVMGSTDADYIFDATGNTTIEYINGQTLRPAKTLPVAGSASYVALYQNQGDWKVTDPDTKIYVPTGNIIKNGNAYEMELQEVTGGGIPDGKPVIVGKEGGLNGIPVRGTSADEANTIETNYTAANPSPAFFVGDGTKTLNELIIAALGDGTDPADYIAFTLIGDKLVALDNSGIAVKAGTCIFVISKLYVLQMVQGTYAPPAGARLRGIPFDLGGGTTGIDLMDNGQKDDSSTQWYDLQGRRLDQAPKAKGVYIRNGILVVIK